MQRSALSQTPLCFHNQEQTAWSVQTAPLSQPGSKVHMHIWFSTMILFCQYSKGTQNRINNVPAWKNYNRWTKFKECWRLCVNIISILSGVSPSSCCSWNHSDWSKGYKDSHEKRLSFQNEGPSLKHESSLWMLETAVWQKEKKDLDSRRS